MVFGHSGVWLEVAGSNPFRCACLDVCLDV